MKLAALGRCVLILDDGGEIVDAIAAEDISERTLDKLVALCGSELQDRANREES